EAGLQRCGVQYRSPRTTSRRAPRPTFFTLPGRSYPLSSATMPIPSSPVHAGSMPVCIRSTTEIPQVLEPVVAEMALHGYSERDVFGMRLSLEEALVNAIKH